MSKLEKYRKKTGGRSKGTPNKTTIEFRNIIQSVIENNIELIENDIKTIKPHQRLDIICKLLSFCIPKPIESLPTIDKKIEFLITKGKTIL